MMKEVDKPTPKDKEVLIKIYTVSLNAADIENLVGTFTVRMVAPFRPKHKILGSDIAGVVESVGDNVTLFKKGDEVYGDLFEYGMSALAEYVCAPEKTLMIKPPQISFEDASTLPQAGIIALQGIRGKRKVTLGQKVLINGAGGGMGTFAIQIAKYYGAQVWGVDTEEKFDIMRKLGADYVIDYKKEDFTCNGEKYDLILDVAAYHPISDYVSSLKNDGIYQVVGGKTSLIIKAGIGASKYTKGTENKWVSSCGSNM